MKTKRKIKRKSPRKRSVPKKRRVVKRRTAPKSQSRKTRVKASARAKFKAWQRSGAAELRREYPEFYKRLDREKKSKRPHDRLTPLPGRDTESIVPRSRPNPRTLPQFRREVVALLRVTHAMPSERGIRLVAKHRTYVNSAWSIGKAPCYVADNIARKENGVRLSRRDPENPKEGEIYESRAGVRWEVIGVNKEKKRVIMRKKGSREVGDLQWNPSVLKGMTQLRQNAMREVKEAERIIEQEGPPAPEESATSRLARRLGIVSGDPSGRARRGHRKRRPTKRKARR